MTFFRDANDPGIRWVAERNRQYLKEAKAVSVRAKFVVQRIERYRSSIRQDDGSWGSGEVWNIKLTPVTGDTTENAQFFAATPSGEINLGMVNAAAVQQFDLGMAFYVDFTPTE